MKKMLYSVLLLTILTLSHRGYALETNNQEIGNSSMSEEDLKREGLQVFRAAREMFEYAESHFNKFLTGSYEHDSLTLKDFVWAFKGMSEGMDYRIIRPLSKLRSCADSSSSLGKALFIVQSVALELHQCVSQLCKSMQPFERTKNKADAYKIAKLIKTSVERFLTKDRFSKYLKNFQEVVDLLSTRSNFNELVQGLAELKGGLAKMGNSTAKIEELKVLNKIMNRISHN